MIPVVGIPYLSNFDLLEKAVLSVVDRAEKVHIIDNSPHIGAIEYRHPKVVITRPHHNIGVAQAWNDIIKWNPDERWWCVINADVALSEQNLDDLEQNMRVHEVVTFNGMHAFGIRASAIQKVGWFDENIHPAYFEDNDWDYRARLLGVHVEQIGPVDYHYGSASIRGDDRYNLMNGRTYPLNEGYYVSKWGGKVDHEVYTTPFNRGGSPREWTLDMTRLANQSWKE